MLVKKPDYVLLFYAAEQSKYRHMMKSGLINEMISLAEVNKIDYDELVKKLNLTKMVMVHLLFLMISCRILLQVSKNFTTLGHHNNTSLIFISQNLFYSHPSFRDISLNLEYIVLLKNRRDLSQINYLAKQLCPPDPKFVSGAYYDATKKPYSHSLMDCTPTAPEELQIRSNIFPFIDAEEPYTVYIRNK